MSPRPSQKVDSDRSSRPAAVFLSAAGAGGGTVLPGHGEKVVGVLLGGGWRRQGMQELEGVRKRPW